jgi:tetratricopeptide (TPR) repeat protein
MSTISAINSVCKHPENTDFLLEAMKIDLTNGEIARAGITALLAASYDCPCTRTAAGVALNALHHFSEALIAFDKALALNEASSEAHQGRGLALLHLGENKKAFAAFTRAIELKKDYAEAYQGLGIASLNLNRPTEALQIFATVRALRKINSKPGPIGSWPRFQAQDENRGSTPLQNRLEAAAETDRTSAKRQRQN